MASAPYSTASLALLISKSKSSILLDEPIFALILVVRPSPIPQALTLLLTFLGITTFPSAISLTSLLTSIFSFFATSSISGVMLPFIASLF